jgi:hypothetical protein
MELTPDKNNFAFPHVCHEMNDFYLVLSLPESLLYKRMMGPESLFMKKLRNRFFSRKGKKRKEIKYAKSI